MSGARSTPRAVSIIGIRPRLGRNAGDTLDVSGRFDLREHDPSMWSIDPGQPHARSSSIHEILVR
jgi:hypothetical protein